MIFFVKISDEKCKQREVAGFLGKSCDFGICKHSKFEATLFQELSEMSSLPSTPTSNNIGSPPNAGVSGGVSTPLAPGVQHRLLLKQTAIDTWSLKEQLGLASAVLRSGDQNWVSVSRQMKPFSEDGRPTDWFSQKNCALQYNLLLNKVDTPRRKRGEKASIESVETPGEAIVRKLTSERIKELRKLIEDETQQLRQLEDDCVTLSNENISEARLQEIENEIDREEKEESEREAAHQKWLNEREEKKQAIQAALKAHTSKLPLKGAAAAAVLQAGAARRASTQSERSSFSDIDSGSPSATNLPTSVAQSQAAIQAEDGNEKMEISNGTEEQAKVQSPVSNGQGDIIHEEKVEAEEPKIEVVQESNEPDGSVNVETEVKDEVPESNKVEMEVTEKPSEEVEIKDEPKEVPEQVEVDEVEDEEDDEVIIKTDVEPDSEGKKSPLKTPRTSRLKKSSEVSEDDSETLDSSANKLKSKRSKKISERSTGGEDQQDLESQNLRATRHRSRKLDSTSDNNGLAGTPVISSSVTPAESLESLENKRLSRVKESEGTNRGRRGSGTTASRSSSPVGSGDESEADQTPSVRSSRSRKKSGHKSITSEAESAPTSPSPVEVVHDHVEADSNDDWKKNALDVLSDLKTHHLADKVFDVLQSTENTTKILRRSIDLPTIRKNVESGQLKTNAELHHSLHHLFLNITMLLNSESEVKIFS